VHVRTRQVSGAGWMRGLLVEPALERSAQLLAQAPLDACRRGTYQGVSNPASMRAGRRTYSTNQNRGTGVDVLSLTRSRCTPGDAARPKNLGITETSPRRFCLCAAFLECGGPWWARSAPRGESRRAPARPEIGRSGRWVWSL